MNIRLINMNEAENCNDFHNRIYGKNRLIEQWKWEFASCIENYPQIPFVIVEDEGKIVGTQAFIPIRMIDEDGVFWTAKSEETLVDTNYRGKKLFEQMYQLLFKFASQNKLEYIWGFTPATKAFERLGFSIPATTSQIFFPFSKHFINILSEKEKVSLNNKPIFTDRLRLNGCLFALSMAKVVSNAKFLLSGILVKSNSKLINVKLKTLDRPPKDIHIISEKFIKKWGGKTIYRDAEYLQWRLFDNPYLKPIFRAAYDNEKLIGWIAYCVSDDGVGNIIDLFLDVDNDLEYATEDIIKILLREAVTGTRNMGASAIRSWRINNHPFENMILHAAKSMGFYHIEKGNAVVQYITDLARNRKSYDNFDNWFITRIFTEGTLG